jgi:hypothetical protein
VTGKWAVRGSLAGNRRSLICSLRQLKQLDKQVEHPPLITAQYCRWPGEVF